ncbi:sialic acid-binding Ig-like lectin 10 isoform X3 [Ascaphus truei]|uniref:sialic acid-binding Ig-like lectin 10 isoform X3 n=1 Tax=Ascaphus truei TaxID=8439 RepID=UPI003F59AD9D
MQYIYIPGAAQDFISTYTHLGVTLDGAAKTSNLHGSRAENNPSRPLCATMWLRRNCCYWTHPVTFILYLMWTDIICTQFTGFHIEVPLSVTVQEGLCVLIPCNFTHNETILLSDRATGYWIPHMDYGNNTCIPVSNVSVERRHFNLTGDNMRNGDCSVIINDARKADSGIYRFRIEDKHLTYSYRSTMPILKVTDLKELPQISQMGYIVAGKEATLTCTAPGKCSGTAPRMTWEKDKKPYKPSSIPWQNAIKDNKTGTLTYSIEVTFTPSRRDHQSSITCKVTFPAVRTSTQKTIKLNVHHPPTVSVTSEIPGHRPLTARKDITPVTVREGVSLNLSCSADSNPQAKITWMKGEEWLVSSVSGQRLELQLRNITPSEADTYRCSAWNKHGNISRAVNISVEYSPRSPEIDISVYMHIGFVTYTGIKESTPVTVKEGDSLTLNCSVDSNPQGNMNWKRGKKTLARLVSGNNLELQLGNITRSEANTYKCSAWDAHGNISTAVNINVECFVSHMGTKASTFVTVTEGDSLNLSCSVDSNPQSNMTWWKGEKRFVSCLSGQRLELQLWNITSSEADTLKYTAWNKHGNISRAVKISVVYSPRRPEIDISVYMQNETLQRMGMDTFLSVLEGSSVSLLCSCDSVPPAKLQWMKGNENITNAQLVGNKLQLNVINGSVKRLEEFRCQAENPYGTSNSSITIIIQTTEKILPINNAIRDTIIGGSCGMIICTWIILIAKFIAKIPRTQPTPIGTNRTCITPLCISPHLDPEPVQAMKRLSIRRSMSNRGLHFFAMLDNGLLSLRKSICPYVWWIGMQAVF